MVFGYLRGAGAPPACPDSPNFLFCGYTAAVASQTHFFCLARKSGQKDAPGRGLYCALTCAIFLAAPRPERPDGRKTVTILIAFGSGKCTTRICGQTASISVLLISGILGRLRCYTAYRVLAAIFFYGLILWHCGTIRFASGVSFCILFLTRQTEPNCKPAKRLQFGEDEQRNGRDLPLAAGRGIA